jgi:hypothetical protein
MLMGQRVATVAFGLAALVVACGDGEGKNSSESTGGFSATGGSAAGGAAATSVGGARASGGKVSATGGSASSSGGNASSSGGNASSTGGKTGTGGSASSAGGLENAGGAGGPSECPELEAPGPDPDDGGTFTGALTIAAGNEQQLGTYSTIAGDLTIGPTTPPSGAARIEDIDLTHLRVVEGDLLIVNTGLSELELPRLERVTGMLWVSQNQQLTQVRVPELRHVGALYLDANFELLKSEFPQLEAVDTTLYIHRNLKLMSWGLDALQAVGDVMITANPALPQCLVDAFNQSTGQMASSEATGGVEPPICDCPEECGRLSVNCN